MAHFYTRRAMTSDEQETVIAYSLTESLDMIEYCDVALKASTSSGALVYASNCGKFVAVDEEGGVSVHEDVLGAVMAAF